MSDINSSSVNYDQRRQNLKNRLLSTTLKTTGTFNNADLRQTIEKAVSTRYPDFLAGHVDVSSQDPSGKPVQGGYGITIGDNTSPLTVTIFNGPLPTALDAPFPGAVSFSINKDGTTQEKVWDKQKQDYSPVSITQADEDKLRAFVNKGKLESASGVING